MNYYKKGLTKAFKFNSWKTSSKLNFTRKDRLLRFGAELVFAICEIKEVEVIINKRKESVKFKEGLAKDVLEIITVFSARLYSLLSKIESS